ncbi:MAG: hypothetical protein HQ546_10280 [Planctomycetes bacterium]|nr:hypothetical protein [Planctomycetota bacterium]
MGIFRIVSQFRSDISARKVTQWCVVVALAMAAMGALVAAIGPLPAASAQPTQTSGQPTAMFAVAGQITPKTYGLYLVDLQREAIVVYEYVPSDRRLELRAARTAVYDLQLESYNTQPPPGEIAEIVRKARRISDEAQAPEPK